jgi:hypothetical protein
MGVDDVDRWAASKYHTYVTREALKENEMDGAALVGLKKVEQKSELGNASLAERKCFWGYIVKLKIGETDVYYPQGDKRSHEYAACVKCDTA